MSEENNNPAGTIEIRDGEDFDIRAVHEKLRAEVEDLPDGELEVRQFPSGASNLTYLLRIEDWEGVLRRPPLGKIPPKAHDMGREAGILRRINPVYPLAPKPYFFTNDEGIIGAPFYVMERRKGVVLDDSWPDGVEPSPELCRGLSETLVDTLVELHAVDIEEAGLTDLGRPEGFLERQAKGWVGRYEKARTSDYAEEKPLVLWLMKDIPESPEPTIIHNDFKLNNLILAPDDPTSVIAVVDWEMTTTGDPLFDLAVSMTYWARHDDPEGLQKVLPTVVSTSPDFYTRDEMMERYAEKSGRDLSEMRWHIVFGYFKLAVILQQIYARYHAGQTRDERFRDFDRRVANLIVHAHGLTDE
ncbi:phosphotransferase family protein [Rubrobacter indicoceani]|uniref:phosphotransferase family protein n=1 Tax=Rubrobacter indicoceani TaxID=2051957 RepID=UPI000E5B7F44|nr:phosphotransferase family protein [Rubrobacter indicoceani]